jgi:hypothetical protein
MEENEMGGTSSTHDRNENACNVLVGKLERKKPF